MRCNYCGNYIQDTDDRIGRVCGECVVATDHGGRYDEFDN